MAWKIPGIIFHGVENPGGFFHGVETFFPWRGKRADYFSMAWKTLRAWRPSREGQPPWRPGRLVRRVHPHPP